MRPTPSEPTRLSELRAQDDPANVARLVRSAMKAPLDPVPRLKGRIRYTLRRKSAWRRRYVRLALVGGILFLTGGVVGAVVQPILHRWQERTVAPSAEAPAVSPGSRARQRRAVTPSRATEQDPLAPDEPALPPAQPAVLVPPPASPPLLGPASPTAAHSVPVAGLAEPRTPGLAPVAARVPKPSLARAPGPTFAPAIAATPTRAAGERPVQTALLEPPQRPHSPTPAAAAPSGAFAAPPSLTPPPAPALPGPTSPLAPSAASAAHPAAPAAPAVAPKPVAPPPPSEQALLSRALRSLRNERRPASALAVLDEYQARFPSGSLLPEAARLRTEALLALGEKPAALAELKREPTPGATGGEESQLVRGELHAAAGRWPEALAEFDAVVRSRLANEATLGAATSAKPRERLERALWGRASARSHLGDDAGARADLHECLRRFPQGRFAGQAARLLGEHR